MSEIEKEFDCGMRVLRCTLTTNLIFDNGIVVELSTTDGKIRVAPAKSTNYDWFYCTTTMMTKDIQEMSPYDMGILAIQAETERRQSA
jgi:hypothetical protein